MTIYSKPYKLSIDDQLTYMVRHWSKFLLFSRNLVRNATSHDVDLTFVFTEYDVTMYTMVHILFRGQYRARGVSGRILISKFRIEV
jgi:hypothetical protein